jgi:hypothetical protein
MCDELWGRFSHDLAEVKAFWPSHASFFFIESLVFAPANSALSLFKQRSLA